MRNYSAYLSQGVDQQIHKQSITYTRATVSALRLLSKARFWDKWVKLRSVLETIPNALIDLKDLGKEVKIQNRYYAGKKKVPVSGIQGTLGRGNNFCLEFAPRI